MDGIRGRRTGKLLFRVFSPPIMLLVWIAEPEAGTRSERELLSGSPSALPAGTEKYLLPGARQRVLPLWSSAFPS